ncbi:MAG: hypothetical protein EU539_04950 [Promethearchaeota archaeon]|nr:MAG: hypothetical protein EU539_04950 [Candidatus Lokiarchaeota archaeon]
MALEQNLIMGLLIGAAAYILLYLGKGFEKYAVEGFKNQKIEKTDSKGRNSGIWIIGFIFTLVFFFIQWIALIFAPVNLIAPLEGIGLVILVIFSYHVLNEELSKLDILGIINIILGTILVALFNPNQNLIQSTDFKLETFIVIASLFVGIELFLLLISKRNNYKYAGLIAGFTAGTFIALSTVTKRITAIPNASIFLIFTILSFVFGLMAKAFSQLAYAKGKANIVIPCFTSTSIIMAILVGIIVLNEKVEIIQIIGITFIIGGILLLTAFKKEGL